MRIRRICALCLALILSLGLMATASAAKASDRVESVVKELVQNLSGQETWEYGREWIVLGLVRSGYDVSQANLDKYYASVEQHVENCGGVLSKRKYTDYSRVILALTAIGKDPTKVAGYDLTAPLEDFDQTVWQGINGAAWALVALDSGNYSCGQRQAYVDHILKLELSGGGWAFTGSNPDADITAMVLQALAKYQDQKAVKAAVDRAVAWLAESQNGDGSFSTMGIANCESTAQVIIALSELGISAEDSRFTKNGKSVLDALMSSYVGGGFEHEPGGGKSDLTTQQAFYALLEVERAARGQSSLYRMSGSTAQPASPAGASFPDVEGHKNQKAIDTLVGMQIINGMGNGTFSPNKTMTRAEFCTITVKALGLSPKAADSFTDVKTKDWFAGYVGTASANGIVNGVGNNKFDPHGTITRQEAAAMVARAAKVLGLDTSVEDADEILLLFSDGKKVASWAKDAVAWCCAAGVLADGGTIQPTRAILRGEIAQMIYNVLDMAGKL